MNRIKELRLERGLSQEELGTFVGKTKHAVTKWESGIREPSQSDLNILCKVLGASSDYLLGISPINTQRVELFKEQLPQDLREAGLEYVSLLREYIDASGGILPEVQQELFRLVANAKLLKKPDQKP